MKIAYVTGDATAPLGAGPKLIVHICNDAGRWGKGFVLAISRRWKTPELVYKDAFKRGVGRCLGDVQFEQVAPDIVVANVIGRGGQAQRVRSYASDRLRAGRRRLAADRTDHHRTTDRSRNSDNCL
jgi:hypothetical protein